MLADLKALVEEFDLRTLLNPATPEAFLLNLLIIGLMIGCAVVVWKLLARIFS